MTSSLVFTSALACYSPSTAAPPVSVHGTIELSANKIRLAYTVRGQLGTIILPAAQQVERGHDLWLESCFECFAGHPDDVEYTEINIAPSRAWNIYRFDTYRTGMREIFNLPDPEINITWRTETMTVTWESDCRALGVRAAHMPPPEINLCAVLLDQQRNTHFYTLDISDPTPDFHRRGSFVKLSPAPLNSDV